MTQQPIRVVLVDDHALCRTGLTELLQNRGGIQVLGATGHAAQVVSLLREHQPDLVVLDLRLAETDGLSVLRQIRADGCETPALILTMSSSEDDLAAALRAGVRGYLLKDMEPDEVIDSIVRRPRRAGGGAAMALKLAQMWQNGQKGAHKRDLAASLTEREREVLEHVARGKSNKVIAQALDISHNTVKLHVRHIMAKLDLNSRVEAAVFAFEQRHQGEGSSSVDEPARKPTR
jgi:two-component system nitrate/nitrite response regulator NarL